MNNDLISRSEIRKHILNMTGMFTDELGFVLSSDAVIGAIETVPTIDAVKVVRCKDCLNCGMKASIKYDGYRDDVRLCMMHGIPVLPDDYCSNGAKMDAEVEG